MVLQNVIQQVNLSIVSVKGLEGFKQRQDFEAKANFEAMAETNTTDGSHTTRIRGGSKAGPKIARSGVEIKVKGRSNEYIGGSTYSSTAAEFTSGHARHFERDSTIF